MNVAGLVLPTELVRLIREGRWPRTAEEAEKQTRHPLIAPDRYQRFDSHAPFFFAPPFFTLQQRIDSGERFWLDSIAAPSEISHSLAVDLGDFGIGSDAAIVLDYSEDRAAPSVKYLK